MSADVIPLPAAGDGIDTDGYRIVEVRTRVAAAPHSCGLCGENIPAGRRYLQIHFSDTDGHLVMGYNCCNCTAQTS